MDILISSLLVIAIITHVLKIYYIVFKPKFLERFKTLSNMQLKPNQLIVYYLVTILLLVVGLRYKLNW